MDKFSPQALAAQNSYLQAVKERASGLFGGAGLGGGMAGQAAATVQNRPYQLHVQEAQGLGQQPLSPEAFAQMLAEQKPKGLLAE